MIMLDGDNYMKYVIQGMCNIIMLYVRVLK